MRIYYKIISQDEDELSIEKSFCYQLKDWVSDEIKNTIHIDKLKMYEDMFLKSTVIDWVHKPFKIDMVNVVNMLLDNIKCYKVSNKHIYLICFSNEQFPNTLTSFDKIARFLDKGNESFPGLHIFSNTFNRYENNINKYWKVHILTTLHRLPVGEVLILE